MKISNSKKELARIISENGGWSNGAEFAAQDKDGDVFKFDSKPVMGVSREVWMPTGNGRTDKLCYCTTIKGWHQTILSRAEYLHLYPAPDADGWIEWGGGEFPALDESGSARRRDGVELSFGPRNAYNWRHDESCPRNRQIVAYRLHKPEKALGELCGNVTEENRHEQVWTNPPTIEQLAADYRNAKDYADRKQQEADDAKADAGAKLKALELAGEAIGLLVSPITEKQDPGLVITDWRDLRVGDIVVITGSDNTGWKSLENQELEVRIDGDSCEDIYFGHWCMSDNTYWRFIRRP